MLVRDGVGAHGVGVRHVGDCDARAVESLSVHGVECTCGVCLVFEVNEAAALGTPVGRFQDLGAGSGNNIYQTERIVIR